MAKILIADTLKDAGSFSELLTGHELTSIKTLKSGKQELTEHDFDLIVATLHFDDSQMFEFLQEVRAIPRNSGKPIICFCTRNTAMTQLMHETLHRSTAAFGAWMYIDMQSYAKSPATTVELQRVIDRCLSQSHRTEILKRRIGIATQRADICRLQSSIGSPSLAPELAQTRFLLKETIERLKVAVNRQRTKVELSRRLKDRVSKNVMMHEDELFEFEELQTVREVRQSMIENEIAENLFGENVFRNDNRLSANQTSDEESLSEIDVSHDSI